LGEVRAAQGTEDDEECPRAFELNGTRACMHGSLACRIQTHRRQIHLPRHRPDVDDQLKRRQTRDQFQWRQCVDLHHTLDLIHRKLTQLRMAPNPRAVDEDVRFFHPHLFDQLSSLEQVAQVTDVRPRIWEKSHVAVNENERTAFPVEKNSKFAPKSTRRAGD